MNRRIGTEAEAGESKRATMSGNYSQGLYEDADRNADEILKSEPEDGQALNIKGGIAFYRGDFPSAVQYFRRAHLASPKSGIFASNYASALIETKAYRAALEVFSARGFHIYRVDAEAMAVGGGATR